MYPLLLAAAVLSAFAYLAWKCSYWQRHGIKGPRGWPLVGSMWPFIAARQHYGDVYQRIYNDYPELSYIGIYRIFNEPAVLLRSRDMIKEILIRNFHNFQDNVLWVDMKQDALASCNPFVAKGESWRAMRSELVPIFTPNKVKTSFPHIESVCNKMMAYVEENMQTNCFEAKNLFSKYTLAVMASSAFSLDAQSFAQKESDFTRFVENLFQPSNRSLIDTIALLFSPIVAKLINYTYVPQHTGTWLRSIITHVLQSRLDSEDNKSTTKEAQGKSDFIQWLIENKQKQNEPVNRATIMGHSSTFLLEGFETSSSLMAFALYEMATNPLEQSKIQNEIDEVLQRFHGKLSYEAIQEMPYLEASLYETLRIYPAMMALLKHCTKSFVLPPQCEGAPEFRVPRGMAMVVPVKAVHHDPEIYPDPLTFNPERFLNENDKKQSCTFLGFGDGPRMCPGGRFGMAQSKAGLVALLSKYSVELSDKQKQKPFGISPKTFLTATKQGIWIKLKPRA